MLDFLLLFRQWVILSLFDYRESFELYLASSFFFERSTRGVSSPPEWFTIDLRQAGDGDVHNTNTRVFGGKSPQYSVYIVGRIEELCHNKPVITPNIQDTKFAHGHSTTLPKATVLPVCLDESWQARIGACSRKSYRCFHIF